MRPLTMRKHEPEQGISRRRFMTVPGGWPTIPAGASVAYQFQSSTYNATATLTATWRSAWM